jgi:hypothetical protein
MCTDFTDLNKCYPKDDFPLTRIDQIVDSAAASKMMALLDCFFGCHQIWLWPEDKERQASSPRLGPIATLECHRGFIMQDPLSTE